VATAGCSPAGGARGARTPASLPAALAEQPLDWSRCRAPEPEQGNAQAVPVPLPDGTPWECATLTAPLDYADPDGETIELDLIRARASARGADRLGSLLFNFGGPGGSGVAALPAFGADYAALHERYDLVSFDPRGVGGSEGLVCLDDRELDAFFAANAQPRDAAQRRGMLDRLTGFADACQRAAGDLLPHLTTANTARDLDLIRQVLGDEKLHYFGASYGTELGAVYAHLFPERVGRAVFDAVVDPTQTPKGTALGQARGFRRALGDYLDDCAATDDCPFPDDSLDAAERHLAAFLDELRRHPLPTRDPDGRRLTESLAVGGIAQALYSRDFWPYLTDGLRDALDEEAPDGTVLLALGDALNGRNPDGTYTTLQSSLAAIRCADTSARYTAADVRAALPEFRAASPVFGPSMAWSLLTCTPWPVTGEEPHPRVRAEESAPILLIGTTGDPATPYEGTRRMKRALGPGVGVELTYEGEGHGAYTAGNACVRTTADAYLLDGKVPEDGKVCD
jgi:pimeloyl-ACP methyl ester carboxylesterase